MYPQLPERDGKKPSGETAHPQISWPTVLLYLLIVLALFWIWREYWPVSGTAIQLDYSAFRQQVRAGNVDRVTISGDEIRGQLAAAPGAQAEENAETDSSATFVTYIPAFGDDSLLPLLEENRVTIETTPSADLSFWAILINLLPLLLVVALVYTLFNRMRRQGESVFSMGQSRARLYSEKEEHTTFNDVAGLDGAKTELREIIEYLKDPGRVLRLGGTVPKGVLLVGPPGTGKTLLAKAVAGEAMVPFFSITGSDFMEMFVGVGASRVRGLFDDARKAAPCIIFIDELDSIGRLRGAGLGGGHDEREQTLNQLLSELDGFESSENVIVMAATNRPDILDPALLRPGRFDRRISVDLPTSSARQQILEIHARNKPLDEDVSLERLARGTPGFSGADLENVLNEAALLAAREQKDSIGWRDIEEARDKVLLGLVREGLAPAEDELRLIAYHEAGHALVAAVLPEADPIHKVTIVPRGRAMGVTQQLPEQEKLIYTREYMQAHLAVMMGGRAAEQIVFDTATSGAENDLKQATQLARRMVLDWGMSERLGHSALGGRRQQVFLGEEIAHRREYSETTAREVDEEIQELLDLAYQRAAEQLQTHRSELDAIAEALLAQEELDGEAVTQLIRHSSEVEVVPA